VHSVVREGVQQGKGEEGHSMAPFFQTGEGREGVGYAWRSQVDERKRGRALGEGVRRPAPARSWRRRALGDRDRRSRWGWGSDSGKREVACGPCFEDAVWLLWAGPKEQWHF
jgi:hypothetical protein